MSEPASAAAATTRDQRVRRRAGLMLLGMGVTAALAVAFVDWSPPAAPEPKQLRFEIVREFDHDPQAFTQGLVWHQGRLFESTGQYGESDIRELNPETGEVLRLKPLDAAYFAEGLAMVQGRLVQLTWQARLAFDYDPDSLDALRERGFPGEGWGLAFDGEQLVSSNGTGILKFHDPETLDVLRRVEVHDGETVIEELNELEFMNGQILANIWHSTRIARIRPSDGAVTGWIDVEPLIPAAVRGDREAVANGIAWIPARDTLLITGKNWLRMYEIRLRTD